MFCLEPFFQVRAVIPSSIVIDGYSAVTSAEVRRSSCSGEMGVGSSDELAQVSLVAHVGANLPSLSESIISESSSPYLVCSSQKYVPVCFQRIGMYFGTYFWVRSGM